jgi:hypothetical protein
MRSEITETSDESPEGPLPKAMEPDMQPAAMEEEDTEHLPKPPDELAPIPKDRERIHPGVLERMRQLRSVLDIDDVDEAASELEGLLEQFQSDEVWSEHMTAVTLENPLLLLLAQRSIGASESADRPCSAQMRTVDSPGRSTRSGSWLHTCNETME